MEKFKFIRGGSEHLDLIKSLWIKLNQYHYDIADRFSQRFRNAEWQDCKQEMLDQSKEIVVDYIIENSNQKIVGFCITRIYNQNNSIGEIDSLFVEETYRNANLGKKLLKRAIDWLDQNNIKKKRILVVAGNEALIEYYAQFKFQPLHIVLEKKENGKNLYSPHL
ncbi:MAG: GNAT family N-acetyltransferase [Bacteroidales bacterium]